MEANDSSEYAHDIAPEHTIQANACMFLRFCQATVLIHIPLSEEVMCLLKTESFC